MRVLLDPTSVERFNSKKLYDEVEARFKEYSINKLAIQNIAEKSLTKKQTIREEKFTRHKSDPTWKATIESEKIVDSVFDFEDKINYLKTQFTDDESIVFKYSLEECETDKEIMNRICKTSQRYYQIKKSCYIKIGLCFGILKPKESKQLRTIAQYE